MGDEEEVNDDGLGEYDVVEDHKDPNGVLFLKTLCKPDDDDDKVKEDDNDEDDDDDDDDKKLEEDYDDDNN